MKRPDQNPEPPPQPLNEQARDLAFKIQEFTQQLDEPSLAEEAAGDLFFVNNEAILFQAENHEHHFESWYAELGKWLREGDIKLGHAWLDLINQKLMMAKWDKETTHEMQEMITNLPILFERLNMYKENELVTRLQECILAIELNISAGSDD